MSFEARVERVIEKLKINRFSPFPFARSGFWQTVYGNYWPILKPSKPDAFHHVILPDGDILVMAENRPAGWRDGQRIMLLVHGLTGSYESVYIQRMCRRMHKKGFLVLRLNLRFCGPGRGLARKPYHCGVSDDTRFIMEWIKRKFPTSPVTQVGFSLGGNVTLKMAGEDGSRPTGNLDSVIAVSSPMCIESSSNRLDLLDNKILRNVFMKYLRQDIELMQKMFPEVPKLDFKEELSLKRFDELYTAPMGGFKDAADYYAQVSSKHYIPEIKIPTLILNAMDDPVADGKLVMELPPRDNVDILLTKQGGHVGFLGFGTSYDEVRWSDQAVARWIEDTVAI